MSSYWERFLEAVTAYEERQIYLAELQNGPINVRMMDLYFNSNLYWGTQPVVPPTSEFDMSLSNGEVLYTESELQDIKTIFNFFGGRDYPIGRKFEEFALYYKTRPNEALIETIADIKVEYGM